MSPFRKFLANAALALTLAGCVAYPAGYQPYAAYPAYGYGPGYSYYGGYPVGVFIGGYRGHYGDGARPHGLNNHPGPGFGHPQARPGGFGGFHPAGGFGSHH